MLVGVFIFREFENSKEDSRGLIFVQFSLSRPEKYKTNHKITLLASEEVRRTFFVLVRKVWKRLDYQLPNTPSKETYSLSFMSVKEGKITRKDPFGYKK